MRPDSAVPAAVEPPAPAGSATPSAPGSMGPAADERSVMSAAYVSRVLRRIAHEILERNKGAADLVVLGIPTRGVVLAHRLAALIEEVEGVPVAVGATRIAP